MEKIIMPETITLGKRVRLSDPCYDMNVWCAGTLENVKPGKYLCRVTIADEGEWGRRVSEIRVCHEAYQKKPGGIPSEHVSFEVGVDSGQAGIFDEAYYIENYQDDDYDDLNSWYRRCCELTSSDNRAGTIDGKGFVSRSGYGDGGYDAFVGRSEDGEIVSIRILFI